MDELLAEFLTETNEFLETVDTQLVKFEADPTDSATLNNIFRLVHTIKGTCGFLGLPRLQFIAHAGETLLGKYRDGSLIANSDSVQLVLESIDKIKEILADLEATGQEPEGDDSELIGALERAAEGELEVREKEPAKPPEAVIEEAEAAEEEAPPAIVTDENGNKWDADLGRFLKPGEVSLADLEAAFKAAVTEEIPVKKEEERRAGPTDRRVAVREEDDENGNKGSAIAAQSIRVNVDVLENLMTMVSELVLTRNQLMQMVRNNSNSEFKGPLQRLSSVTMELQDSVMKTRMQPVGSAWKKIPRIVRDAARDLGKKIDLVMEGEGTELDRQVLELIKDPLTHMIRNSCDHAIETPEARLELGKPETGTIRLNAYHEGGHIVIELSDDGSGLNTARIRDKAIKNGLVSEEAAWTMQDSQIHRFIFAPGFSTAAQVTSMSGRGVGMDVVKTNIELIGGEVDLVSHEGKGTKFLIKIPLTLAIVSALVVGVQKQRFAIPQLSVIELVSAGGSSEHKVETLNKARVLRLRNRLLPLVSLSEALGIQTHEETRKDDENPQFVVVMQVSNVSFGVVVDEVFDTEEIVVKPLSSAVSGVKTFSGATILGDGSVIMIIDPAAVAKTAGETSEHSDDTANKKTQHAKRKDDTESLIIFRAGGMEPKAVPLGVVTRLEDLDTANFENSNGRTLVQYRGSLMQIMPADPYVMIKESGSQPILVFTHNETAIGLAVDEIVDIVEEKLEIRMATDKAGALGIAIIKGKATEVLDVGYFLTQTVSNWDEPVKQEEEPKHIVLVEKNPFFRNLLSPLLKAAGYDVEAVDTVSAALICAEYRKPAAILADIDDDKTSAMRLLSDDRTQGSPIVALSGSSEIDASEFSALVRKSDRYGIISTVEFATKKGMAA